MDNEVRENFVGDVVWAVAGAFHNIWSHIANLPTDDIAIDGTAELFRERLQELTVAERDSETDMPPMTITLPDQGTA